MHPHLAEVLARLNDSRAVLADAVNEIPEELRRTRPAPDRWSVAEVLEHLAKVNRFFAGRMAAAIDEARAAGVGLEQQARNPLPEDIVRKMADRTDRRAAREAVMPSGDVDSSTAWDDLDRAREEFRAAVMAGDGLALGTVTAEHRLFGVLNVYQWVELTASHEIRHAAQIREAGPTLQRQSG